MQSGSRPTSDGLVELSAHKVQRGDMFCTLWTVGYPLAAIQKHANADAFLQTLAEGNQVQKPGSRIVYLQELENTSTPGVDYKIEYPAGRTGAGGAYPPGYGRHRQYLIGNQVCWLSVEGAKAAYDADPENVDALIERFFNSLVIRAETPPASTTGN